MLSVDKWPHNVKLSLASKSESFTHWISFLRQVLGLVQGDALSHESFSFNTSSYSSASVRSGGILLPLNVLFMRGSAISYARSVAPFSGLSVITSGSTLV